MSNSTTWAMRLQGSQNAREHHMVRARRVKAERVTATMVCRANLQRPALPCVVTLVRVGPVKIDSDNLHGSLKAVRDGVADWLGVDDGDESKVTWVYRQERGAFAVCVHVDQREIESA